MVLATKENVEAAKDYVNRLRAGGGEFIGHFVVNDLAPQYMLFLRQKK